MGISRIAVHDQFRRLTLYSGVGLSAIIFLCIAVYGTEAKSSLDDSDLDSIPDTVDIDDDNDGIPDRYEITAQGSDQDHDHDGIPDRLDLDSDNDGILDVEESGLLRTAEAVQLRFEGGRIRATMGLNGFVDLLETAPDSGRINYKLLNSDEVTGDVLPDYLDLDSDNDGLIDMLEAGVPLSLDKNNDGRIDAMPGEVGSDGILDSVQLVADANCCDYTLNGKEDITPRNTDGGDFPDYQDHDSDNDGVGDLLEAGGRDLDNDGYIDGFVDDPLNPDGIDDAFLLVPLSPGDSNENGVDDYLDNQVQYMGEDSVAQPVNPEPENPGSGQSPDAPVASPDSEEPEPVPAQPEPAEPEPAQPEPTPAQPELPTGSPAGADTDGGSGNGDADPTGDPQDGPAPSGDDPTSAPAVADDANPQVVLLDDPIETGLSGNGGCSLASHSSSIDPLLPALCLLSMGSLVASRRRLDAKKRHQ